MKWCKGDRVLSYTKWQEKASFAFKQQHCLCVYRGEECSSRRNSRYKAPEVGMCSVIKEQQGSQCGLADWREEGGGKQAGDWREGAGGYVGRSLACTLGNLGDLWGTFDLRTVML